MAFAFGITYGLEDIKRANELISRELDHQLEVTRQLSREQRMITGRPAYTLGAGETVASNAVQAERSEEVKFNAFFDKKIREFRGRAAGTIFERVPGRRTHGFMGIIAGVERLASGQSTLPSEIIHAAIEKIPVAAIAAAIIQQTYKVLAEPSKKVMDAIRDSNLAFRNLQKQFSEQGERLISAPIDTGALRGFQFDPFEMGKLHGFEGRMEASNKLAKDVYEAATALLSAEPKDAARYLNLTGNQSRSSVRAYVRAMLEQGEHLSLRLAARDMKDTLGRIKKQQQAQQALFDDDPEAAAEVQMRRRGQEWLNRQRAKGLQDWSSV